MKTRIGITMGDVCGVGPEITARALVDPKVQSIARPCVIGDAGVLARARDIVNAGFEIVTFRPGDPIPETGDGAVACAVPGLGVGTLPFGAIDGRAGAAAYHFIEAAVDMAKAGQIDAIVTAPLNKEALHAGGYVFPGHTEILAD
nr:4-hydroxythreonine-4-phosphate dehydrogenase PdxA [Aurantimonas sp. VKM B-3413]